MIARAALLLLAVAACGAPAAHADLPVSPPPRRPTTAPARPLVVIDVAGHHYAVIAADADPAWGGDPLGAPMNDGYLYAVTRPAPSLPPQHAAWVGRTLAVHDGTGAVCDVTIDALHLLAAETPPFGVVDRWQSDVEIPPLIPAQIADAIDAGDEHLLVADLGACRGVVALPADAATPAPTFFARHEPDPATRATILAAFAALPASRAMQRAAERDGVSGRWNRDFTRVSIFASRDRDRDRDRDLAFVSVYGRGGEGCGGWTGELSALFVVDHGELRPLRNPDGVVVRAAAMADLDGDGSVELIGTTESAGGGWTIVDTAGGALVRETDVELPFHACLC